MTLKIRSGSKCDYVTSHVGYWIMLFSYEVSFANHLIGIELKMINGFFK